MREWSRRSVRCSRATDRIGVEITHWSAIADMWDWAYWEGIFMCLGKILISREDPKCVAGQSRRGRESA